jgi:hypothetical protein
MFKRFSSVPREKLFAVAGILAFAVIGTMLVLATHAATVAITAEAENGTVTNASVTTDTSASGGSAVKFSSGNLATKKVAVIGDSLTYQTGSGVANITAKYVSAGYTAGNISVYGVGGKPITAADSTGKTTVQNIADARTKLGTVDAWVIALGTNNTSDTDATFTSNVNTVLNAIGSTDKVVWIGLSYYSAANTNASHFNPLLSSAVGAKSNAKYADWNSFIHNGRDETGLWVYPTDSTHMTDTGYVIRNQYYVDQTPATGSNPGTPVITASTKYLQKDGANFYPKGFNSIGNLQPDNCPRKKADPTNAANNFNQTEMDAIKTTFHGNSIRMQVSQKGLDPQDSELSSGGATYMTRLKNSVSLAQKNGLTVILSMQDQVYSCGFAHPLPSSATVRAWQNLAPQFKDNKNIIFELYNEPRNAATTTGWAQWRNGGTTPLSNTGDDGSVMDVVGHQKLVDTIRATGATNVLLADGANLAGQLQVLYTSSASNYLLTDSLKPSQIGYAIHPYYYHTADNASLATDTANWTTRFLYLRDTSKIAATSQFPLMATEWNSTSNCYVGQATRTTEFLNVMRQNEIGMMPHAIDIGSRIVQTVPGWQPTTFAAGDCPAGGGAGQALADFYGRN